MGLATDLYQKSISEEDEEQSDEEKEEEEGEITIDVEAAMKSGEYKKYINAACELQ